MPIKTKIQLREINPAVFIRRSDVRIYLMTFLSKIEFSPQRRRGRRVDIFCLAVRGRQTKRFLSLQYKAYIMCHSRKQSPILFPAGWSFCSNRRLPFGAEEIFLSGLCGSAVKPGLEKGLISIPKPNEINPAFKKFRLIWTAVI